MSNKNIIILVVVVIAFAVIYFMFLGGDKGTLTPKGQEGEVSSETPVPLFDEEGNFIPQEEGGVEEMIVVDEGSGTPDVDEPIVDKDVTTVTENIVTYIKQGFNPKTIEISVGDTVTFINESSTGMWIASASHPTHKVYPEKSASDCIGSSVDACKQVVSGESWSFTFNEAGQWFYHNHVRTSDFGSVIVK